jgi:hypothetical protein
MAMTTEGPTERERELWQRAERLRVHLDASRATRAAIAQQRAERSAGT